MAEDRHPNVLISLYIGHREDLPHAAQDGQFTRCGWPLRDMKKISEKQAQVFLGDRRCGSCFPFWNAQKGQSSRG